MQSFCFFSNPFLRMPKQLSHKKALLPRFRAELSPRNCNSLYKNKIDSNGFESMSKSSCDDEAAVLQYPEPLEPCTLLKRYKRFLGDVRISNLGKFDAENDLTIYVPNTGPMIGLLEGIPKPALVSTSRSSTRKYKYTLEWLKDKESEIGTWVGIHSAKANVMVRNLLQKQVILELGMYNKISSEVKYGENMSSRVDFVLENTEAGKKCYVEVKSVTLTENSCDGKIAVFPDTNSVRARKHVKELTSLVSSGKEDAALVFLIQRGDCIAFAPSWKYDPVYAALVNKAHDAGVKIIAVSVELQPDFQTVCYKGTLPLILNYGKITESKPSNAI